MGLDGSWFYLVLLGLAFGSGVGLVVNLRQVLVVQAGVDLGGADVGVAEQLLHPAQIRARLQQVTGKGVPEHVRVNRRREPRCLGARSKARPNRLSREPCAMASSQERSRTRLRFGWVLGVKGLSTGQPIQQGLGRFTANGHTPELAALAHDKSGFGGQIDPALGLFGGLGIEPRHLTHPQATAIEQLHHQAVSGFEPHRQSLGLGPWRLGICALAARHARRLQGRLKIGQLHGLIHTQGFGQGLLGLGRLDAQNGIGTDQALAVGPAQKTTPARDDERYAACTATALVHFGDQGAQVLALNVFYGHTHGVQTLGEPLQIQLVQRHRASGQAFFKAHVVEITLDPGVHRLVPRFLR